ncbi:MAG TPA: hypothetical protein PLW14_04995 [Chlorobiota bacterium]|nr:hypothetical protein [Chlorobiota bacterium]
MATDLEIYGPVPIPYQRNGRGSAKQIGKNEAKEFWECEQACEISNKQGCYVFALKAGRGYRPWYVGKATKSMRQECTGLHQLSHYNEVLFKGNKGTPVLFFVVPGGNKVKVSKTIVDEIETFLIQTVLTKHPEIQNIQKTNLPKWTVKGVVRGGRGKRKQNASDFRKMMGLSKSK